eukprot:TRINITY_DN623_c0_g1_i5.p1 TRINITY_DN623_c0_g1~~TRINITY_DN623_c0_g1_i5.p1  ORF type:complete len:275 (-),score=63.23 TRINITY_DN623_c0_g1_i5:469-1293(-)
MDYLNVMKSALYYGGIGIAGFVGVAFPTLLMIAKVADWINDPHFQEVEMKPDWPPTTERNWLHNPDPVKPAFAPKQSRRQKREEREAAATVITEPIIPGPTIRVVQYNILADVHAALLPPRILKQRFPFRSRYSLTWSFRRQLLIKEMKDYDADVMLLADVDHFDDLQSAFGELGYDGIFCKRPTTADGCAIFYKRDKMQVETQQVLSFQDPSAHPNTNVALILILKLHSGDRFHAIATQFDVSENPNELRAQAVTLLQSITLGLPIIMSVPYS